MNPSSAILFAGPTLSSATAIRQPRLDGMIVVPPIKRGDLEALTRQRRRGMAIIADGYFHLENLSVGHAEIRDAMAAGWVVWGVSSMGAIRAAEMVHLGMHGFGRVFERYRDDPDFRDDEVALLHEAGPPYRALSEPLVHIREALDDLRRTEVLAPDQVLEIIEDQMQLWFGERTLVRLAKEIARRAGSRWSAAVLADFDRFRTKSHDLLALLESRPWITRSNG